MSPELIIKRLQEDVSAIQLAQRTFRLNGRYSKDYDEILGFIIGMMNEEIKHLQEISARADAALRALSVF